MSDLVSGQQVLASVTLIRSCVSPAIVAKLLLMNALASLMQAVHVSIGSALIISHVRFMISWKIADTKFKGMNSK